MSDKQKNSLFREKNMEKINSPEILDQYLKVTSPGIWMVLVSVILLLIGIFLWSILGNIESHKNVAVVSDGSEVYCLVPEDVIKSVANDPVIKIDQEKYELDPETAEAISLSGDANVYVLIAGDLEVGDIVYKIPVKANLKEDIYQGDIVTETLKPISLLFN